MRRDVGSRGQAGKEAGGPRVGWGDSAGQAAEGLAIRRCSEWVLEGFGEGLSEEGRGTV